MGEVSLSRPKAHGSLTFASLLLKAVGLLAGIGLSVIGTSEILTPPAQYSAGCATPGLECQTFTQISPYLPFSLLLTGSGPDLPGCLLLRYLAASAAIRAGVHSSRPEAAVNRRAIWCIVVSGFT